MSAPANQTTAQRLKAYFGPPHILYMQLGVLLLSLFIYLVACVTPALRFDSSNGDDPMIGFNLLLIGWMAVFYGQFGWFANPLLALALLLFLFKRWLLTLILVILTLAVAANTLTLYGQTLPADEAGVNKMELVSLGVGFYLWIASMVIIGLGAIGLWALNRRAKQV